MVSYDGERLNPELEERGFRSEVAKTESRDKSLLDSALSTVSLTLDRLSSQIDQLYKRLSPILTPNENVPKLEDAIIKTERNEKPSASYVTSRVDEFSDSLRGQIQRIVNIIDRLEI